MPKSRSLLRISVADVLEMSLKEVKEELDKMAFPCPGKAIDIDKLRFQLLVALDLEEPHEGQSDSPAPDSPHGKHSSAESGSTMKSFGMKGIANSERLGKQLAKDW